MKQIGLSIPQGTIFSEDRLRVKKRIDLSIPQGAIFSDDRRYRYVLWRVWNPSLPVFMQVGLNPSKADEIRSDPTITRGIVRADRNGFGAFLMGNLDAYVSTDPKALLNNGYAVGEFTDYYIKEMVKLSSVQLCGWGSFKGMAERAGEVFKMLPNPFCLGVNADGQPKHPLYVGYEVEMKKYELKEIMK